MTSPNSEYVPGMYLRDAARLARAAKVGIPLLGAVGVVTEVSRAITDLTGGHEVADNLSEAAKLTALSVAAGGVMYIAQRVFDYGADWLGNTRQQG